MNKKIVGLGLTAAAVLGLAACGNRAAKNNSKAKTDLKVAIVTDTGGVDDKSFNQSAWEGLQAWGKDNGLSKGDGFDYFQSANESDYATNLDTASSSGYKLILVSVMLCMMLLKKQRLTMKKLTMLSLMMSLKTRTMLPALHSLIMKLPILQELQLLKQQNEKVGFVGGVKSAVITRFEKGFEAGVKSVDKSIQIQVDYAGSFGDAAKGKTIAAAQYAGGADVVYQAAGGTGAGVFSEAKALNEKKNESKKVWVIGVDRDQAAEGKYTSKDGKKSNFVLASSLKEVGKAVQLISNNTADKKFPGGKVTTYGLKDKGVDLAPTNLSDDAKSCK